MSVIICGALGFLAAVGLWSMYWISKQEGNEKPLTPEEIRRRVGETWE